MMYVASLISGVGIFCVGGGVSAFKGVQTLIEGNEQIHLSALKWAFVVLAFSFVTEFVTLNITMYATFKGARENKIGVFSYSK